MTAPATPPVTYSCPPSWPAAQPSPARLALDAMFADSPEWDGDDEPTPDAAELAEVGMHALSPGQELAAA